MVDGLRIRIDRTLCVGFGECVTAAPEAFALDGEDMA
ncbi:MAG: ferredoxin, partial [Betaproteobacteria bacterium]|nr:ferredoxin [Betaproteobacteria bacterium]